jgi:hypothetical protein
MIWLGMDKTLNVHGNESRAANIRVSIALHVLCTSCSGCVVRTTTMVTTNDYVVHMGEEHD